MAGPTDIAPLAEEEPFTRQHVNPSTVTVPVLTLYDDEVETTAKFIDDALVIVRELPEAIVI